jgi:hypothetical protein
MRYLLQKHGDDRYDIANDDSDHLVASVYALRPGAGGPGYRVQIEVPYRDDDNPEFVVNSIDETIPAVAAYYEQNPPRWQPESAFVLPYAGMAPCRARYRKKTQFGTLWVDQIESEEWVAYRMGYGLSSGSGEIAKFATREEAQRAADVHYRDGYPNSETINDEFSWLPDPEIDWRADPYRVANRARLAVT